ncbi:protein DDI1 homolog 2 isoform X1 [Rhincodon typus]|uniref:protein DDI1 homolog 2 isoform X1 n=1 Tax=Rhincodon typus TaxID=259920 RepID=UPI00202F447B|nr:protein DDI1 homolog 2 isoform X1 [Rhincodon typus]
MEPQAEKQALSGSLANKLTPLFPYNLSTPSQASLGENHIPQGESIPCSSQDLLNYPTSDTNDESLPKHVLPNKSPYEVGMEKGDTTRCTTKAWQEIINKEGLEEPPTKKIGEISSAVQSNSDPVSDLGLGNRLSQQASPELAFAAGSNINEMQQGTETGKGIDDPDNLIKPLDMDLEIAEKDPCSCQKKFETNERPPSESSTGNIEICDAEIVNSTQQLVEEIRYSASKKTEKSSQKEGKVTISDQKLEDGHLSSCSSIAQENMPAELSSGCVREKSEFALVTEKEHGEVHPLTEIKQSSFEQDQTTDSDSHFSPVAALFELHQKLVVSCQEASLKISVSSEDNHRSDMTNQEEGFQLMEVSEECSDNNALSRTCVNAEVDTVAVEEQNELLLTANSKISPKRDNSVESFNEFPEKSTSDMAQVKPNEIFVQASKDEAAAFITVSKDQTKEMEVSHTEESLQTQELSVHPHDSAAAESSQNTQSSEIHLQEMTNNVVCSSEDPEVLATPMTGEGTMEANMNQPNRHSLGSPLEVLPLAFPAANVARIRRSGFTQQEALEALERFNGNTDLALLVLLARNIVVPI